MKLRAALLGVSMLVGCGYQPLYAGRPPEARLSVSSSTHLVAETGAVDGVLAAVRRGLSRDGVLAGGEGYPRLVVEVLRVEEAARGLLAETAAEGGAVTSRGAAVAVTARGWVVETPGAPATRDTGDVRRATTYAHSGDVRLDALARAGAVRDAAERAGEAVARRVLGYPEPSFEDL